MNDEPVHLFGEPTRNDERVARVGTAFKSSHEDRLPAD